MSANSKLETRNSKQIRSSNCKLQRSKKPIHSESIRIWIFGFASNSGFRVSNFPAAVLHTTRLRGTIIVDYPELSKKYVRASGTIRRCDVRFQHRRLRRRDLQAP